jgi:thymidylate kinase
MAKLIVFEGPDKCGKETQSKLLVTALRKRSLSCVRIEPSKEAHPWMRKLIYWMLDGGAAKRFPNTFQFIQFLNKAYFQAFKLPKLLQDNHVVILDRWGLSGYVYGKAEGIYEWLNRWMFRHVRHPDITLIMTGTSYRRSSTVDDSYERDTELQAKVKDMYHEAGAWPDYQLIDNRGTREEVNASIVAALCQAGVVPSLPLGGYETGI